MVTNSYSHGYAQREPLPAALGLLAAARHGLDEAATS